MYLQYLVKFYYDILRIVLTMSCTNIASRMRTLFHLTNDAIRNFTICSIYTGKSRSQHIRQTSGIYSNTRIWVRYTWTNPRRSNYDAHTSRVCRRGGLANRVNLPWHPVVHRLPILT